MKSFHFEKTVLFTIFISLAFTSIIAQSGRGIHYQAVARNSNGEVIANQELTVRIAIVDTDSDNEIIWLEEHLKSTSSIGIFNLIIGGDPGNRIGGSTQLFEDINWQAGSYSLNVQVKLQNEEFIDMGTSPIMAVPYALVSEKVQQPLTRFSIQNDGQVPQGDALFEVLRADGRPVFAVYEDGVWVYTDTADSKGIKGGFAVGGYNRTNKGYVVEEYMRVTPDSVRIYIDDTPSKGIKGGFAVGGYNRTNKSIGNNYMSVFKDSIRFHVGYEPGKGRIGGFAISGRNPETGKPSTYMFLTRDNYFIGESSGINNTTGMYNTMIGYRSGENNTEGSENVMLGYMAGNKNITGAKNVFIGDSAGYNNLDGSWNIFMGRSAGHKNETGFQNVFIGGGSGEQNIIGNRNLFLGIRTGLRNIDGDNNCFLGQYAGYSTNASSNVFIGNYTGARHEEGDDNVFIGTTAGNRNYSGLANVFIGRRAGQYSDSSSFNVAVGNQAGLNLKKGEMNVLIGNFAGSSIVETHHNTFIGANAGQFTETGSRNTFVGNNSGLNNVTGQDNTYIGVDAGRNNLEGVANVCIGINSGENSIGGGNVFIGRHAGRSMIGSNILIIDNEDMNEDQSLIYGKFDEGKIRLNSFVGINVKPDSAFSLKTIGDIQANDVTTVSDARFKTNIQSIPEALDLVLALEGVRYKWDRDNFPLKNFDAMEHYGFIAQELEQVIPQMVITGSDGYKSVNYQKITTILVEALKQQQVMIDEKERRINKLESRLDRIEAALIK